MTSIKQRSPRIRRDLATAATRNVQITLDSIFRDPLEKVQAKLGTKTNTDTVSHILRMYLSDKGLMEA